LGSSWGFDAIVNSTGSFWVVWDVGYSGTTGRLIQKIVSDDNGTTWHSKQNISESECSSHSCFYPRIAQTSYGYGIVYYGNDYIHFKNSTDGNTWSSEKNIAARHSTYPVSYIGKDSDNNLYILYTHPSVGNYLLDDRIVFNKSTDGGNTWSSATVISSDSGREPFIFEDSDGKLWAFWRWDNTIYWKYSTDGGNTWWPYYIDSASSMTWEKTHVRAFEDTSTCEYLLTGSGGCYRSLMLKPVGLNKTLISEWLGTCIPGSDGSCNFPIKIHSDTYGKVQFSNIRIFYDYNISELYSKTSDIYYVEAGKNITRTINLNHTDRTSPVNFTYNGIYWPSDGGVLPLSCEVDGTAKTFENGYCSFTESISSGNYFTNHSIKFYKGVLVNKSQVESIWNDTIVVDKNALVYFNVTACNNDNIGYSNILVRADLPSIYSNVTPYIFYDTINSGSCSKHSFINATGIPVVEVSFTGPDIITLPDYFKYTYTFTLNVRDGNVSSKNITYLVLKSDMMDFGKRDPTMDLVRVDGNSTGIYSEDYGDYYRINITTEHGSSSLEEGTHSGEIIYYVPITGGEAPSAGGGGGGEANYMVVRPTELFIPIYDECNSTLLNITWYGQPEITASILISDDIRNYILQPKSGDKILLRDEETTTLPIKACIPEELKQELMETLEKGVSGTMEIRATTRYGSVVSQIVPIEIRKYAIEVVKPAKPLPPKPKPLPPITVENIAKIVVLILIVALVAKFVVF